MAIDFSPQRPVAQFNNEKLSPVETVYTGDTESQNSTQAAPAGRNGGLRLPWSRQRERANDSGSSPAGNSANGEASAQPVADPKVAERRARPPLTAETVDEDRYLSFEQIHIKYKDKIFNHILRVVGNWDDAEELTVETFVNAYKHWGRFRGEARVSTWLYQIAVNNCKNRFKQRDRQREREPISLDDAIETDSGDLSREVADWRAAPESVLLDKELAKKIQEAIDALPEEYRTVLLLQQDDLSYEEIAQITGLTVPNIKTRLHRARNRVAQRLEPYYRNWVGRGG